MKTKWFISLSLLFTLFATVVKGFTVDGTASPGEYPATGQPLAVQTLGSNASASNPTNGNVALSSGSQLDAAYGVVSNGTLYLLLAGNMKSDVADLPGNGYDKLSVFIDTGAPGQHTLANNDFDVDQPSAIKRMSAGGDLANCSTCPGLTFDTGFNASYWIGFSYGNGTNPTLYVNYATLPAAGGGFGTFVGGVTPGTTNSSPGMGIVAAMNNVNTSGVDTNLCNVNTNGAAQSIAAAAVKTGIELSVPLNQLGGPSIVGPIRVVAFLSTNDYTQIYDQVLGPVTINGCVDAFAFGDPLTNDFSTLPGAPHYFTLPLAGCSYTISPFDALYGNTGGTGSVAVGTIGGTCGWSVTSSVPWVVITSALNNSGAGSITYTVTANPSTAVRVGTITLTGTANGQDVFTITEGGQNLTKDFTVDGTREPAYGCPLAVQQIGTGYGNATNGNALTALNGSELDAAYGMVENNVLFLVFAGNLENNGNKLMVFFDTGLGGSSVLSSNQSSIEGNNLNHMGTQTNAPGFTFDTGFSPGYWMGLNCNPGFFADYAQLWPGGTNSTGVATNGYFLGKNNGTNGVLTTGTNPFNIQATINNSNTNGVDGGNCSTNAAFALQSVAAATVTNGVELGIPLAALGNPTGTIKVCAMITSGDAANGMSNQLLPPLGTNDPTYCQANLSGGGTVPSINLSTFPGQHYFVVGPEVRIKTVQVVTNRTVLVNYQTAANANLTYQLQKTTGEYKTNNAAWSNVGGLQSGNGGIITGTDLAGGTNKPGAFYRVRQTPLCQ